MTHGLSSMRFYTDNGGRQHAAVAVSHFQGNSGVEEYHLMVSPTAYADAAVQLTRINEAYRNALASLGLDAESVVMQRVFCSDLANQAAVLDAHPFTDPREACAVSRVCQPPALPAKIALWAYHVRVPGGALAKRRNGNTLALQRGDLTHLWTTGVTCPGAGASDAQTRGILERYEAGLRDRGLTVADHVLRTWFFVQNIDANYHGLVAARRAFFASRGLTPETHFIASTGIQGGSADIAATVTMDAYAVAGVRSEQIRYLAAPDHLCPTHRYGVTFERGVSVAYRDRTHVIISGTASIDPNGSIVHPGDVARQLDRTLVNVDALLRQAGATLADAGMFIVYVRDPSDAGIAQRLMTERGGAPMQIVIAPVCRPGWLIEVECQAVIPATDPELPPF